MANRIYDLIDGLNISRYWKNIFKKIHLNYHNNYSSEKVVEPHFWSSSDEVKKLLPYERFKLSARFNYLGFLLGPFIYLLNQMYIKGLILLIVFLLLLMINDVTRFLVLFELLYCACFINIDNFVDKVLKNPETKTNPLLLRDDFDYNLMSKFLIEKINPVPYIVVLIIFCLPFASKYVNFYKNNLMVKNLMAKPKDICSSKNQCITAITGYMHNINSTKNKKEISKNYYLAAWSYFSIGDTYNAISLLVLAISFDKSNIAAYLLRANIRYSRGENIRAILDYKEAVKLNPNATFLNYYIGLNYYEIKKNKEALKYLKRATASNKEAQYFEIQAYAKHRLGDLRGAKNDAKHAVQLYEKQGGTTQKINNLKNYIYRLEQSLK